RETSTMRKRKREGTHQPVVYKFRAYLKDGKLGMLPDVVYHFSKRQQEVWNALATEQDRRWKEWQKDHPPVPGSDGKPKFEKPGREWWTEWESWMRRRVHEAALGWEAEGDIMDRFSSALRRLGKQGGAPKLQKGLRSFSIPHRYTGGGVPLEKLGSTLAERFRVNFPSVSAYWKNDRDSRRARVAEAQFMVGESTVKMSLVMHREIPPDAIIKGVRLIGWKQSPTLDWEIYVAITAEIPLAPPATGNKIVGIDVGWRTLHGKLRTAVCYDGTKHSELFVFLEFRDNSLGDVSLDRQRSCQLLCDAALEQCKTKLKALGITVPAQARNGFLMRMLRDVNTPANTLPILELWKRDNDSLRRKIVLLGNAMTGRRDHRCREWAADIADRYDVIRVEALDLPEMYSLEANKEAKDQGDYALWISRERRKLASVGLLISVIENAARMRGKAF
ncbi:MAG: hypothetical protein WCC30_11900, partial [Candidatus Dormiibacterota bacterium]